MAAKKDHLADIVHVKRAQQSAVATYGELRPIFDQRLRNQIPNDSRREMFVLGAVRQIQALEDKEVLQSDIVNAVMVSASFNAVPGDDVVWVPFYSKKDKRHTISTIFYYKFLRARINESGLGRVGEAQIVYQGDDFINERQLVNGTFQQVFKHRHTDKSIYDDEHIIGVYVDYHLAGNDNVRFMRIDEVNAIRDRRGDDKINPVWRKDYVAMVKKTIILQVARLFGGDILAGRVGRKAYQLPDDGAIIVTETPQQLSAKKRAALPKTAHQVGAGEADDGEVEPTQDRQRKNDQASGGKAQRKKPPSDDAGDNTEPDEAAETETEKVEDAEPEKEKVPANKTAQTKQKKAVKPNQQSFADGDDFD